jgi:photosystem II stability/assembly factor-like uncharacterized protein
MATEYAVYVGTVGEGIWRSADAGETFQRRSTGMFVEADARALILDPHRPQTLLAGTNAGLYRTEDGGDHWQRIAGPFDPGNGWPGGCVIWSLLAHPRDPQTLFVGTCPPAVYRSTDGGASWQKLPIPLTPECPPLVYSRVTSLVADPEEADTLWVGVEIGGVWRSRDGGERWEALSEGLSSQDIHALALVPGQPRRLLASTNNDLNLSTDEGATWQPQNVKAQFPYAYCRGLVTKPDDPNVLFLGNGNGPPGTAGTLQISRDGGRAWHAADLPTPPNSTIWTFAANAALPDLIFGAAVNGKLYRSQDGGATWTQCRHEFGEVRALAIAV